jgi:NAD+ synthase (glutamine-hydrolysing)
MRTLRLSLAQINSTVGDIDGNTQKILAFTQQAKHMGSDIVVFPELAITGYPPEDLLLKPRFIKSNLKALESIRHHAQEIIIITGFVDAADDIYNAAAVLSQQQVIDIYHKQFLPNYGVFDENRYFQAGKVNPVYQVHDINFGLNICEDIWYAGGPTRAQSLSGAKVIININASPYHYGKISMREKILCTRAMDNAVIIAYVNMVGGQDELVFDGASIVASQAGEVIARAHQFEEEMLTLDLDIEAVVRMRLHNPRRRQEVFSFTDNIKKTNISLPEKDKRNPIPYVKHNLLSDKEEVYKALILGTTDYVYKNGFQKVIIGLSGGVDSALVTAIAVDSLGKEHVTAMFMPSPYSSDESREDAAALAKNLDINFIQVPVSHIFNAYREVLADIFKGLPENIAEENLQARIRGNLLMALSNKFNRLVLTTGNKSENSVGYATLYGDMAGGFAVIKDVPKMMVYELCRFRNEKEGTIVIPERILTKAPTAELKPDQKDSDSLPPYHLLDPILKAYVEDDLSLDEIISFGADSDTAREVIRKIDLAEYKRRQAPPGIKITPRAFGKDRRFPITNRFRNY